MVPEAFTIMTDVIGQYERISLDLDNDELTVTHNSIKIERSFLSYVEHGESNKLISLLEKEKKHYISIEMPIIANDPIRAYKNVFVTSITLVSRAAIRGGMSYEASLKMSDRYLQYMETLNKYNDVHALWEHMFLAYTKYVEKCRRLDTNSKLVRDVCNYVMNHVSDKINETEIAAFIGLNRSYLCRQFKRETHKKLSEYINESKIVEAKELLRFSSKPLIEISEILGYSSQNYFQTIFKKITSLTPLSYRNQN
ncbi:AraC family transcriptional regulator [Oenococcus sp. UCMA 17063]|nr:AraC family transcriptional regulator [Oenococcus sp. UCMA 17063]